ncbi:MAG: hypothetical protein RBR62_04785, partial [Bacteroidales bacterium]|nr:hypothetical protein [Bacteroidales bacterium]
MKRFFHIWIVFAGLIAVSCGTGYQSTSSAYDDAAYFRPGVTARVQLLATAQEAEALKNKTLEQAAKEGTRVETIYTDPDGSVDIDVKSGTTYLIMSSQDDSYERKLEMFSDEPQEDFSLTINMSFTYDDWYYPGWYDPWYNFRFGYSSHHYWMYHWYYPWRYHAHWHSPYWYSPYWYSHYWYSPYWYADFHYPYYYGYPHYGYNNRYYFTGRDSKDRNFVSRQNTTRRISPGSTQITPAASSRSGGSYRRVSPQINQVSGDRRTETSTATENTGYRRVGRTSESTGNISGKEAVYRAPSENTYYRRSSNSTEGTRTNTGSDVRTTNRTTTTNPGSSRSFYRDGQRSSTTAVK